MITNACGADDGWGDSQVRLEDNTPVAMVPTLLADNRQADNTKAVFFNNSPVPSVCTDEGPGDINESPVCVVTLREPLAAARVAAFLNGSDIWLEATQQVQLLYKYSVSSVGLHQTHLVHIFSALFAHLFRYSC